MLSIWVSSLFDRLEDRLHCPYCSGKLPIPNENSFAALYPEYLKEWNWELNKKTGREPDKIFPSYKYIVNWICIECNFPYNATIQERLTNINCCPNCNSNTPIDKENYERVKEELYNSSDKNYIYPNSKKQITWRCNCCDMLWSGAVYDRLYKNINCPYCSGELPIRGKTSFKALYPELAKEQTNNSRIDLDNVFPYYATPVSWKCNECKFIWKASPRARINGVVCPYCSGKYVIPGKTSFKALFQDLADEQDDFNEIDLDNVFPSYATDISWKCNECKFIWRSSPRDRINGVSCPYCAGKKAIPGKTSFKALYPDLMKEWKSINHIFVDANLVTENYSQSVWWKCSKCNTSYEMSLKARAVYYKRNQESCGYCKGYRRTKNHII